jgi:DNA-binding transcriptional MerR regulator
MTVTDSALSISEAADVTGVSTHTLRYYERAGLMLVPIDRASSSHRRYMESDVNWVTFLTKLRSTSMPIARVRAYVDLCRLGQDTVADRLELLLTHRVAVAAQLAEMTKSLAAIDFKIATYQGSYPNKEGLAEK